MIPTAQKGVANGVATLGTDTKVPAAQLPAASTSAAGIAQLNDAINSTSTTQAATANAAKKAYDRGSEGVTAAAALQTQTASIVAQTAEATITIPSASWLVNDGQYTYAIQHVAITAEKEVKIILDDACKAKYAIYALDPVAGAVTLCVDARPTETITGRVLVREVRT